MSSSGMQESAALKAGIWPLPGFANKFANKFVLPLNMPNPGADYLVSNFNVLLNMVGFLHKDGAVN
jgi:hypothetical protein